MSNALPGRRGVSLWAHPMTLIVFVAMGIVFAAFSIREISSQQKLYTEVLAGLAVGLPAVFITKRLMRKYRDYYANLNTTQHWSRWPHLLCSLPLLLATFAHIPLSDSINVDGDVMICMPLILCILLYPEQKAFWLKAKARVAEMEKADRAAVEAEGT